jgi:uncharacterized membrane protein YesL
MATTVDWIGAQASLEVIYLLQMLQGLLVLGMLRFRRMIDLKH